MKKLLHINAHNPHPVAPGKLSEAMTELAINTAIEMGYEVQSTKPSDNHYDVDEEIEKHQWADIIIIQAPIYWMGMPWRFKQYMDDVYTAGTDGRLCHGDGRKSSNPKKDYGSAGSLTSKKYMFSLSFNAPQEAFNDESEYLFQGKSVDDLLYPMHVNYRFFRMEPLETFVCFDVLKNPQIESDFERFKQHMKRQLQ
ncbi:MAG: NAD(P)H-dependent oxidoreductase [Methylophilaceae bacterium]